MSTINQNPIYATELVKMYDEGKLHELSNCDLSKKIDEKHNTVIHIIAKRLDKKTFDTLRKLNGKCFTYANINEPNGNGNRPLHKALKSINKLGTNDYSFITYMIDTLGADPSLPNNENIIIVKSINSLSYTESDTPSDFSAMKKSPLIGTINYKKNATNINMQQADLPQTQNKSDSKIEFIRALTAHYKKFVPMDGGKSYSGKRMIGSLNTTHIANKNKRHNVESFSTDSIGNLLTESGNNDKFTFDPDSDSDADTNQNLRQHWNMIENMSSLDRPRRDPEITSRYNEILKKIMEFLDLNEDKAKTYRSILKLYLENKYKELKGPQNDAIKIKEMEKIVADKKELKKYWKENVEPEMEKIEAHMRTQAKLAEERKKEFEATRQDKPKKDKFKKKPKVKSDTETSMPSISSESTSESESEKPKKKAAKKPEKKKAAKKPEKKISENGYIRSDELIFSTEEY